VTELPVIEIEQNRYKYCHNAERLGRAKSTWQGVFTGCRNSSRHPIRLANHFAFNAQHLSGDEVIAEVVEIKASSRRHVHLAQ
jgi:hypothetical protein